MICFHLALVAMSTLCLSSTLHSVFPLCFVNARICFPKDHHQRTRLFPGIESAFGGMRNWFLSPRAVASWQHMFSVFAAHPFVWFILYNCTKQRLLLAIYQRAQVNQGTISTCHAAVPHRNPSTNSVRCRRWCSYSSRCNSDRHYSVWISICSTCSCGRVWQKLTLWPDVGAFPKFKTGTGFLTSCWSSVWPIEPLKGIWQVRGR